MTVTVIGLSALAPRPTTQAADSRPRLLDFCQPSSTEVQACGGRARHR
jgi:hypothetical protein